MIKLWSVSNFKSIKDESTIAFAPLTLFVGQNSAGKSTLIQSILLTAQTIQSNVAARSVVLNGRIIRLGSFADIRANNSNEGNVTIAFELGKSPYGVDLNISARARYYYTPRYQERMTSVRTSFSISAGILGSQDKELQLQPRLEQGTISYQSIESEASDDFKFMRCDDSVEAILSRLHVSPDNVRIPDLSALNFQVDSSVKLTKSYVRGYRLPTQTQIAGVLLRHFLPVGIAAAYDSVSEEVDTAFEILSDSNSAHRFRSVTVSAFSDLFSTPVRDIYIEACQTAAENIQDYAKRRAVVEIAALREKFDVESITKVQTVLLGAGRKALALLLTDRETDLKTLMRSGRPPKNEISGFSVAEPISYAVDYVTGFFSERLKYLGPLRDEPRAIYPLAGYNDPKDIGFRGEFTAAVLDNNKTSLVTYIPSDQFPFSTESLINPVSVNLVDAVQDWLEYLGIAKAVATEDKGKLGHELTITTAQASQPHDLTHVGVGVSQALPIVVLSLLADAGSTLIFEQPELHLNPKVQTRLADFFMSLVFAGKQCVVETHSEYLISRLRYLSAMAKEVPIAKLIKIYFVEKPADQSIYKEVEITESGVIKNWPVGFFDETEQNSAAIILAQVERSRARRRQPDDGDAK